jgi:hypothetical protein
LNQNQALLFCFDAWAGCFDAWAGANQRKGRRSNFATGKRFVKIGPDDTIFFHPAKTSTKELKQLTNISFRRSHRAAWSRVFKSYHCLVIGPVETNREFPRF